MRTTTGFAIKWLSYIQVPWCGVCEHKRQGWLPGRGWGFFCCSHQVIWPGPELAIAMYSYLDWENRSLVIVLCLLLLVMSSAALLLLKQFTTIIPIKKTNPKQQTTPKPLRIGAGSFKNNEKSCKTVDKIFLTTDTFFWAIVSQWALPRFFSFFLIHFSVLSVSVLGLPKFPPQTVA